MVKNFMPELSRAGFFFNVFEKTQAEKNSRSEKTQAIFGQKLNGTEAFSEKNLTKAKIAGEGNASEGPKPSEKDILY